MKKKRATIKDVAQLAGVSMSVVSYVLNGNKEKSVREETKQKIWSAVKELNYTPNHMARNMRRQKAMAVGIVSFWDKDNTVFTNILNGVVETSAQNQCSVVICNVNTQKEDFSYVDYYTNRMIDGIVFIAPAESMGRINEEKHIQTMKKSGVPFVVVNGHTHIPGTNYIYIDFFSTTYRATEYLILKGYSDITYIAPKLNQTLELVERQNGYCQAMKNHKLKTSIDITENIGLHIENYKAVVTNKSDTAHRVLDEALHRGIQIPQDLVVIAGNTESYSEFLHPPLTTVRIPTKEMGELAAKTLLEHINEKKEYISVALGCSIVERKST